MSVSTEAKQTATEASTTATSAYTDAQTALTQSTTATQTATAAKTTAESASKTASDSLKQSSAAVQTANQISTTLSTEYQTKADADKLYATQSSLKQTSDSLSANIMANANTAQSAVDKATSLEANLNGFKTTVAETYTTKNDFNNLTIGGRNLLLNSNFSKGTDNWVLELQNNGLGTVKAEALSGFAFATTMLTIDVTKNTSGLCRIYQLRSPNPMRTDTVDMMFRNPMESALK